MDFSSQTVSATEAFTDEEESLQVDQFLASLNTKRKAEPDSEESLAGRKRAKAWATHNFFQTPAVITFELPQKKIHAEIIIIETPLYII